MPTCFQPENLRGKPINRLKRDNLEYCFGGFADEGRDSAITSYNFLHQSRINMFAFMGASVFVLLLLIIIVSISICTRQRAHYYTREDGKGGKCRFTTFFPRACLLPCQLQVLVSHDRLVCCAEKLQSSKYDDKFEQFS